MGKGVPIREAAAHIVKEILPLPGKEREDKLRKLRKIHRGLYVVTRMQLNQVTGYAHTAKIKSILPLFFENDPNGMVEAIFLFDEDDSLTHARASRKAIDWSQGIGPDCRMCGVVACAGEDADQLGIWETIEMAAKQADMGVVDPGLVITCGFTDAIEQAWKRRGP